MTQDSFGEQLLKLMLVRTLEGESQIDEHIQWNRETKALVPLAQALTVAVGITATVTGLIFIAIAVWEPKTWPLALLSLALIPAGLLLTYRQARELLDPFGKLSPMERMIRPYVGQLFTVDPPQPQPGKERIVLLRTRGLITNHADEEKQILGDFGEFVARLPHKGTTLRAWEEELGRDIYNDYRDKLIEAGYAQWKSIGPHGPHERQGWKLTVPTRHVLTALNGD
jgi:hypothetical protein